MGQSTEFMELYRKAGEVLKEGDSGITTTEISGKLLQELLPAKTKDGHVVGRIEKIRQIKFEPSSGKELYLQIALLN